MFKINQTNEIESSIKWINLINKYSKPKLSKGNIDKYNGEETFEIN